MSEQRSSEGRDTDSGPSRPDPDRAWWAEPDPVELFATGMELALRQLHVEVAGLRAERDGLRLEVEGLRAKLSIAQEQLAARDGIAETVHQLQAVVARLTIGRPDITMRVDDMRVDDMRVDEPAPTIVADPVTVEPIVAEPIVAAPIIVDPVPIAVAPIIVESIAVAPIAVAPIIAAPIVEPSPVAAAAPVTSHASEPSAIDQLKAMGLWPTHATDASTRAPSHAPIDQAPTDVTTGSGTDVIVEEVEPAPPPAPVAEHRAFAPPDPAPFVAHEPSPPQRPITWDPASTRKVPVLHEAFRDEPSFAIDGPIERSAANRWLRRVGSTVGAIVVVLVMLVTVGPRFLPYQTYFVRSGSMEPTIHVGAMVVLTKTTADRLVVGNIITFDNPDKPGTLVTHRIVGIENNDQGRVFATKGDANGTQDSWRVPAKGTGWKYAFNVPFLGFAFGYLGTPQARLALLAIPGFILGLLTLLDIWRPKRKAATR